MNHPNSQSQRSIVERLRHIKSTVRRRCVVCSSKLTTPLIKLPDFPLTEIYISRPLKESIGFIDQEFFVCPRCGHGQLGRVVDPKALYAGSYFFRTSLSATAREASDYFLRFVTGVIGQRRFKMVLEVGCNDLYLLKILRNRAAQLVGIDPVLADQGPRDSDPKILAIADFIENVNLKERLNAQPDLVLSSHVLEHIEDPVPSIKKLLDQGADDALFCFQFPGLESLVGDFRFDQIFHQHLSYFTQRSVRFMLERLGCELIAQEVNPYHWGALMIAFRKKKAASRRAVMSLPRALDPVMIADRYRKFQNGMALVHDRLASLKKEKVYGYGAALMLPVLSYHLKNDLSSLECVVEDDPQKSGLFYVNLPVKIRSSREAGDLAGTTILITATTAVSNVRSILPKVIALKPKQIIVPLNIF